MRFLRNSLSGLFLFALTLGLMVYAATLVRSAVEARLSDEPRMPEGRERVFAVNLIRAEPETIAPVLTAFGQIQSRRTLDVRANAAGRIVELSDDFVDGGAVEAGQVLARIDPSAAESDLSRAEADLADAVAEQRDAERALEIARDTVAGAQDQAALRERALARQRDLQAKGVGSAATVEEAELAASTAQQSVLAARSALAQAEARVDLAANLLSRTRSARADAQRALDETVIRAGFSGTLTEVMVVEGGLVSANEQLARLVDGDALEVAFRVSTQQYARLLDDDGDLRGAPVEVTLDAFGSALTAKGQIARDSAAVGEGLTGRLLLATLGEAPGLKPGDFVSVHVQEEPLSGVVRLPASAVDADETVLALGADERLDVVPVTLERRQGDDVLVRADALHGREVVAQRSPLLGAGIKVRALAPAGAQAAGVAPPVDTAAEDMVELTEERRAELLAIVEANARMPEEMRTRLLSQIREGRVPAQILARLEARIGG